jgi:hypothetical protein
MKIRALSVFEGVVYHSAVSDPTNPCRPALEVEAVLREGDADATSGPLLLPVAEYIVMVGGLEQARPCLLELRDQGRIERRLDVDHISFPMWERLTIEPPGDDAGAVD